MTEQEHFNYAKDILWILKTRRQDKAILDFVSAMLRKASTFPDTVFIDDSGERQERFDELFQQLMQC